MVAMGSFRMFRVKQPLSIGYTANGVSSGVASPKICGGQNV